MISKTKEVSLDKAKKMGNSWGNRNTLHIDVTGRVAEYKSDIGLLLDYFRGVIDDDTHMTGKGKGGYGYGIKINMIDYRTNYENFYLNTNNIYSPGKGITGIDFVKLNDKNNYILELKNEILKSLEEFYGKGEISYNLIKLKFFFEKGFITKSEILDVIHVFLRKKSGKIIQLLIDNSTTLKSLSTQDLDILSWGTINNQTILNLLNLIKFDDKFFIYELFNRLYNRDLKEEMFSYLGLPELKKDEKKQEEIYNGDFIMDKFYELVGW